jgi:GT2 family glycosyltransferase
MLKIVTLTAVHNRKDHTLKSLCSLAEACDLAGVDSTHCIVDDNSSDGTSDAILELFPQAIILRGDGNLYWAGGMRHGFNHIRDNCTYDFLVAYNDDCVFDNQCIHVLLKGFGLSESNVGIVVGSLVDPKTGILSYGGKMLRWNSRWLPPSFILAQPSDSGYKRVDTLNMNLCCISKDLLDKAGFLNSHYIHSGADYDYGLRIKKTKYRIILAPSVLGFCSINSLCGTSRESLICPIRRIVRIFSVKEYPLPQLLFYYRSHGGRLWLMWLIIFYVTRLFRL